MGGKPSNVAMTSFGTESLLRFRLNPDPEHLRSDVDAFKTTTTMSKIWRRKVSTVKIDVQRHQDRAQAEPRIRRRILCSCRNA